jgi:anti-sigma-K factor RskA
MNRPTPDQLTQLDLIHTETGVSAVALSADDLEMLAQYVVGVIAQNDRQRAERKARRCGLINFRVQEYASRVFAARLNAETRKQNEPCLK